jgi:hypothetical protein
MAAGSGRPAGINGARNLSSHGEVATGTPERIAGTGEHWKLLRV